MTFAPKPNDCIEINGIRLCFTPYETEKQKHRAVASVGRKSTVYRMISSNGILHALKVFEKEYRTPRTAVNVDNLLPFADLPGMQVSARTALVPGDHKKRIDSLPELKQWLTRNNPKYFSSEETTENAALISNFPDLEYAVLMPWVSGRDWKLFIMEKKEFTKDQAYQIAGATIQILSALEKNQVAHGDISGGNVKVDLSGKVPRICLVDVDDMFAPGIPSPEQPSNSTPGYNHKVFASGRWDLLMDRFASAVILSEMLGWYNADVRSHLMGDTFFNTQDMQRDCEKFQVLSDAIKRAYGVKFEEAFSQAWFSKTLEECPTLSDWNKLFNDDEVECPYSEYEKVIGQMLLCAEKFAQKGEQDKALDVYRLIQETPRQKSTTGYLRLLRQRGSQRERDDDFIGAIADYTLAIEMVKSTSEKATLEKKIISLQEDVMWSTLSGDTDLPKNETPYRVIKRHK
jgi:serine/threonine protein kinase